MKAKFLDFSMGLVVFACLSLPLQAQNTAVSNIVTVVVSDEVGSEMSPMLPAFDTAAFTLRRTGPTNAPLTIAYLLGGTATPGVDYQALSGLATIPAGTNSVSITIVPIDDLFYEPTEKVILTLNPTPVSPTDFYLLGSNATATVFIRDNDPAPPPAAVPLIRAGSPWKYWAQGTAPTAGWKGVDYSDAEWSTGLAQLGCGDGDETTVLMPNPAGTYPLTAYFRQVFEITNLTRPTNLVVGLLRDDGAVVYLNGVEIRRDNMPAGEPTYQTLATVSVGGADEFTFFSNSVPVTPLRLGRNVLAVELHQSSVNSTDLSFDLSLTAQGSSVYTNELPVVTVVATDPEAAEPNPVPPGMGMPTLLNMGAFTISRTGPTNAPLRVFFNLASNSVSGGAQITNLALNGLDYELIESPATIPAGATSVVVYVIPIDDQVVEGTEFAWMQIYEPMTFAPVYTIGERGKAMVTILDNDATMPPVCVNPPANLVGWWRAEGNANDAAGANQGTVHPGASFARGLVGQTFEFTGATNSYVEVPDAPSLRAPEAVTIEFWVKRSSVDFTTHPVDYILEKGGDWTGGAVNYGAALHNAQYNHCLHFTFAGGWRGGGRISDTNNWHHCAIVARHGDTNPALYVDGVEQPVVYGEGSTTINLHPSTQPLHIGALLDPATGWYYFGRTLLDELAIYNRALTAAEIQSIFRAGAAGKCFTPPPPVVTIRATDPEAAEPNPLSAGAFVNAGQFTVHRTGPTNQPLTVSLDIAGSAENGTDYARIPTYVTIPAGASSALISIVPLADTLAEGTEIVRISLPIPPVPMMYPTPPPPYMPGTPEAAEVRILDYQPNPHPPSIAIVSPPNGVQYTAPALINLRAEARDAVDAVQSVEFFAGDRLLGVVQTTVSSGGYSLVWSNVMPGEYTLTARATDAASQSSTSAPVRITVKERTAQVMRTLPPGYAPGMPFTVTLKAIPNSQVISWAVEDHPPAGWTVGVISHGGQFDATFGKVKFGPFMNNEPRTLTYAVTPPENAAGIYEFSGSASFDGSSQVIGGMRVIGLRMHPADANPADWRISMNELTAFSTAWLQGASNLTAGGNVPIHPPISYVTRAGMLWRGGEFYTLDPAVPEPPLCWVNLPALQTQSASLEAGGAADGGTVESCPAQSAMPANYTSGQAFTVSLAIQPKANTQAYAVEEMVPPGWMVSAISDAGVFHAPTRKIRWGLFLDAAPRTLSYAITPAPNTDGIRTFQGVASFDGVNVPIAGRRVISYAGTTPPATINGAERDASGAPTFSFIGEAGRTYIIEYSPDLKTWYPLKTVVNTTGIMLQTETAALSRECRYYRVRLAP